MSGNCLLGLPKTTRGGDEIHFWSNTYGLHVPAFLKIKKGDPKANPNWTVTTLENKRHWEVLLYCGKTLMSWKGSPQYSAKQKSIICSQMTYLTVAGGERWVLRNLKLQRELLLIEQHDKKIKPVWNYIWSMGKLVPFIQIFLIFNFPATQPSGAVDIYTCSQVVTWAHSFSHLLHDGEVNVL